MRSCAANRVVVVCPCARVELWLAVQGCAVLRIAACRRAGGLPATCALHCLGAAVQQREQRQAEGARPPGSQPATGWCGARRRPCAETGAAHPAVERGCTLPS